MKPFDVQLSLKHKPLVAGIRRALAGGLVVVANTKALATDLPVAVGAGTALGTTVSELTNPALHPNIDVGHASASYSANGQKLTINQATDKALLEWQSFDVGAGKTVQFVQPTASSVALNNIHQLDASKIYGDLSANGQVYLVNANGFVFGKNSSVNVNSLVATNLKIGDAVFDQGIANVVDTGATGANPVPIASLSGDGTVYRNLGNGQREKIKILVESGAKIATAKGGRVIMAAPEVENAGEITAPDGQVILAAATDKVYLQASETNDLRGLLVEVNTGGDVKNIGKILTERGNTTMLGFAVSQQGVISASTSVALNGSVRLLAREGARLEKTDTNAYRLKPVTTNRPIAHDDGLGTQAQVVLYRGSLTSVDLDDGGTAIDEQNQPTSKIDIEGGSIRLKNGAQIAAHAGEVNLTASAAPDYTVTTDPQKNKHYVSVLKPGETNNSRVILESGSNIDVSGIKNVEMAMNSNVVDVELRNYELRDAPLQKTGILHGKTVHVDIRKGTTLADASGAIAKLQHSIYERSVAAGSISLQAEGDVIIQTGAQLDISGGYVNYLGGYLNTTQLVSNGQLFDIASADPNRIYQRIINGSYYQTGYQQGGDAGRINIKAHNALLDGTLLATTVNGLYQRDPNNITHGGQLTIDLTESGVVAQDVYFQAGANSANGTDTVPAALSLSPALFTNGVNSFSLDTLGKVIIPRNTDLTLAPGGQFTVTAGEIDMFGRLNAAAGNVTLIAEQQSGLNGRLQMGNASWIDTSGRWLNDFKDSQPGATLKPLLIDGGDIHLQANGDLRLAPGSRLTADGGARLQTNRKITDGRGGNITLVNSSTGVTPNIFELGATLSSYALQAGGALNISADSIDVSANQTLSRYANGTLYLSNAILQSGGFGAYSLKATDGILQIQTNTRIQLQQSNWQLNANVFTAASDSPLSTLVHQVVLPDYLRQTVDLELKYNKKTALSAGNGTGIRIGENAWIGSDQGAVFSLNSDADIVINGTLNAPAGKISIALNTPNANFDGGYDPNLAIILGANGHLNATGTSVLTPNGSGLLLGEVKSGGTISLTANRGYIVTDAASTIDVSGSQAQLDIVNSRGRSRQIVASAGGDIRLTAAEGIIAQGQLMAKAGIGNAAAGIGSGVAGGSLSLTLNAQQRSEGLFTDFPSGNRVLHISADPGQWLNSAQIAAANIPLNLNGQAYLSVRQIEESGADNLTLTSAVVEPGAFSSQPATPETGEIRFDGAVNLSLKQNLTLDAPLIGHSGNGHTVLNSNTFSLGSSWNRVAHTLLAAPAGTNNLTVNARLIDLFGASKIADFAQTRFLSRGDIRLIGIDPNAEADLIGNLSLAGDLSLAARQIYPTTFSNYTLNLDTAAAPNGTIAILPASGTSSTPLSAVGQLTINAPHIRSQGRLLAPFGTIQLNAWISLDLLDGSITSVSADTLIPFGRTQGDLAWLYPLGDFNNIQSGTPQKSITLSGPDIDISTGASVNLNGGGNLSAFEFIAGAGGSVDVLDTSNSYAILPSYLADFAAYDPIEFGKSGLTLGDSIHLSADLGRPGDTNYLAAGDYVLLPAHYALLPDAFLVTPQANTQDMAVGTTSNLIDGTQVIAGYRYSAATVPDANGKTQPTIADSRWSGFAVESGEIARTRSEYQETTASQFFDSSGNGLPQDAGNLTLLAGGHLDLAGTVSAISATGGLGGLVDISATRLTVVNDLRTFNEADGVGLLAAQLNNLNVDSLLLGGRRQRGTGSAQLTVGAQTLTVAEGVGLHGREILLAARDTITVAENAKIAASGNLSRTDTDLNIVNTDGSTDGALLRISAGAQAQIHRAETGLTHLTGILDVRAGALLSSAGSTLLDGSKDSLFYGSIKMDGGDLSLSSSRITLGGPDSAGGGLHLAESTLNGLNAGRVTLNSSGSIEFSGEVNLTLKDLTLNAATLLGRSPSNQPLTITANAITLNNTGNTASGAPETGDSILNLIARHTLTLGQGHYAWSGFKSVQLSGGYAVINDGNATLATAGDVLVSAPLWTANAGANTTLNLGDHTLTVQSANGTVTSVGLGARLTANAGVIDQQGLIRLAGGGVTLNAAENLTISGAIDTSGRVVNLADAVAYAGGGYISLSAGDELAVLSSARLDVSGSSAGGDAGSLVLSSANGNLTLEGNLQGNALQGAAGGNFTLDSKTLSNSDFSGLIGRLQAGGFAGDIAIRQRQGDLTVAASNHIRAANLSLATDSGALTILGELNVSGGQAGKLQLAAGDELLVLAGAKLSAVSSDSGKAGGTIVLTSTDADGDSKQGVTIASGARLDVSGAESGGEVSVIVNRLNNNDAAVSIADNSVTGAASRKVTAMAQYATDSLSNSQIKQWYDNTQAFFDAATTNADLTVRLADFKLLPGLDIQSTGSLELKLSENLNSANWTQVGSSSVWQTKLDNVAGIVQTLRQLNTDGTTNKEFTFAAPTTPNCTLNVCTLNPGTFYFDTNPNSSTYRTLFFRASSANTNPKNLSGLTEYNSWDFTMPYANGKDWHFGDVNTPGLLVVRAAQNLDIEQNLSDGIARYDATQLKNLLDPFNGGWKTREVLQTGESWSYQLVAGADLSSANLLGLIRAPTSGTGNLTIGTNTRVRTGTGTIDVAAAGNIQLSDWTSAIYTMGRAETTNRYGNFATTFVGNNFFVEYPIDGGDVSLHAGGDIVGAASSQFLSDWLQHIGQVAENGALTRATAWGIAFDSPNSVSLQNQTFGFRENIGALGGGNVDVTAGDDILDLSVMLPTTAKPIGAVDASGNITENVLQIRGGGDLNMLAGRDIAGGVFYVDNGEAEIKAGRTITGGKQFSAGPIFAIGDAQFDVKAGNGISVGAVLNPFTVGTANFAQTTSSTVNSYFTNYSTKSAIALQSLAGNIDLNNNTALINEQAKKFQNANSTGVPYLASLGSTSLMQLYPGNLAAYALSGDINVNESFTLLSAPNSTLDLASWGNLSLGSGTDNVIKIEQLDDDPRYLLSMLQPARNPSDVKWGNHADSPVHWPDQRANRLIAAHGSIIGNGSASVITAKATNIYSGLDFKNLSLEIQNLHAGDISNINVSRDIKYQIVRDALTGAISSSLAKIEVAGPGLLNIWAGRDIDLGVSQGITTVGNIYNVNLPAQGADISVLAGSRLSSDNGPLEDFLNFYVGDGEYQSLQTALDLQSSAGSRLQIALSVLFSEIRVAAKQASVSSGAKQQAAYQRGYDAINRLFPDAPSGDIKLFFSKIQTLQGGDINLLAPGGMINIGLASGFTGAKSDQADLGVIAQRQGDINILVKNDLQVNQQRIFTLDSGDITAWSSEGNIDAGRGAKSALTTAAPVVSINKTTGQLVVEFPPTISGSGIRAQSGYNSDRIGDVILAAPKGVVDAGEAGIGGQNVTIVATAVIGASNIQVLGSSVGFGQTVATPVVPSSAAGTATAAASNSTGTDITDSIAREKPAAGKKLIVANLISQIIGFGQCSISDIRAGKPGCGG